MEVKKLDAIYQATSKLGIRELVIETKSTKIQMLLSPHKKKPSKSAKDVIKRETAPDNVPELDQTLKYDILSPQIGFFSRYNVKTKKHYVKLRDQVKKGDVVASIRSMHLIYDVVAEKSGKIIEFLVEEGQPVEYHQPVIRLIPVEPQS